MFHGGVGKECSRELKTQAAQIGVAQNGCPHTSLDLRADHEKHEHEDVLASDVIAELAQIDGHLSVILVF